MFSQARKNLFFKINLYSVAKQNYFTDRAIKHTEVKKVLYVNCYVFQGVLLVYDITNARSFDQLQYWLKAMNKVQYDQFNL